MDRKGYPRSSAQGKDGRVKTRIELGVRGRWTLLALSAATLGCNNSASQPTDGGGGTDSPPDVFLGTVVTVGTFGCFARSGDGNDYFADGSPAAIVTASPWRPACDLKWIGLNANGYTKPTTPTTETITRTFSVDRLISDRATFTVSFEADDAAEIVLNGKSVASCSPPAGNAGECQQSCHVVTLSKADFNAVGQENRLEMKMININNTNAGGGNTGYTGISYSICATSM